MKYYPQLDSLRAIAVIFVLINHWLPPKNILNAYLPNGPIGVTIFFVLSGFLITKILFDSRIKAEVSGFSKKRLLINFYARRALRIFPIYYLTIFLLLIFHDSSNTNVASDYIYFITYTSNFYFFQLQDWDGAISHLWTLSVEEQFYLIWPWLILFVKREHFMRLIIIFILIGTLSQVLLNKIPLSEVLTFTCFDAFGLGALLAWQVTYNKENLNRFFNWVKIGAAIAIVAFLIALFQNKFHYLPARTVISVVALWLISFIVIKHHSSTVKNNFILNNGILIFIGKISYGIYLYHNFFPSINSNLIQKYFNPMLPEVIVQNHFRLLVLVENTVLLLIVSWLSYIFIEKRFLNLKKYFDFQTETDKLQSFAIKGAFAKNSP